MSEMEDWQYVRLPTLLNLIMSLTTSSAIRCCVRCLRTSLKPLLTTSATIAQHRRRAPARRWQSTAAASSGSPKVAGIVDQISQLTLLETADLVSSLKVNSLDF
ncbi:MAG: hypothetical protein Q9187_005510 [Circinaria calcarea]